MTTLDLSQRENQSPTSPTLEDSPTIPDPMFSLAYRERAFPFHGNIERSLTKLREDAERPGSTYNNDGIQETPLRSTYPHPLPPYELPATPNQIHELPVNIPDSPAPTSDSVADSARDLESGVSSTFSMDEKYWREKHFRSKWAGCRDWFSRRSSIQKAVIRLLAVVLVTVIAVTIGLSLTSVTRASQ